MRGREVIPERVTWAVEMLGARPSDHVLEIGCGPGHAVGLLCERLTRGTVTAIDRSALQVSRARERNQACIAAGRARIEHATLTSCDAGVRRFDRILAINVNAFWTDPAPTFASVRRLLRPRGTLVVVYEPPSPAAVRKLASGMRALFDDHELNVEGIRDQAFRKSHGLCIVGRPLLAATERS